MRTPPSPFPHKSIVKLFKNHFKRPLEKLALCFGEDLKISGSYIYFAVHLKYPLEFGANYFVHYIFFEH